MGLISSYAKIVYRCRSELNTFFNEKSEKIPPKFLDEQNFLNQNYCKHIQGSFYTHFTFLSKLMLGKMPLELQFISSSSDKIYNKEYSG